MIEDKSEDETYSLIFASLKHPIRRRILRMLAKKPLTYSEILEILSIDSGHFSYHLDTLGDLTFKDKTGRYHLSSFGKATAKLMGGVEENVPTTPRRRNKPTQLFAKAYSVLLVLVLVCASAFFISYVSAVPDASETTRWAFSSSQSSIIDSESSNLDFILAPASSGDGTNSIDVHIGFEGTSSLAENEHDFFGWYDDSMWLEITQTVSSSQDGMESSVQVSNDTLPDVTELPSGHIAKFYDPKISEISLKTDFSRLLVDISLPNGTVIADCLRRGEEDYSVNYVSILQPGWSVTPSDTPKFKSYEVPIDQLGSYNVKITNEGDASWSGTFSVYLQSQRMERPFFFLGIAGLAAAIGYLVFVTATSIRRGEPDETETNQ